MKQKHLTDVQQHLLDWLGSDDGHVFLISLSSRLLKDVERHEAVRTVWPYPAEVSDDGSLSEEVAHDFFIFLAEVFIPKLPENPELVYLAESGNIRKLFEYARRKFLWSWQEKSRSKVQNPAGYLYRRLRETVSSSSQFLSGRGANRVFLFKRKKAGQTEELIQTSLAEESLKSWQLPPESGGIQDEREIYKEKYLHQIALFFWEEACARVEVQALAVRDLQRYLLSVHSWLFTPSVSYLDADCAIAAPDSAALDIRGQAESISLQAALLTDGWTKEQCAVFLMRLEEPPVKLKTIAEYLGLADHNIPHRLYTACADSIRSFAANWPGPPLAELPEECGEMFLEQIKECAKKRIAVRNIKQRSFDSDNSSNPE